MGQRTTIVKEDYSFIVVVFIADRMGIDWSAIVRKAKADSIAQT